jgi:hypothetical protein
LCSVSCVLFGQTVTTSWKTFSSRAGWSMSYPKEWHLGSCRSCPDPTAQRVFVDFFPPSNTESGGWMMVEQLLDKPSGTNLEEWFAKVNSTANLNPQVSSNRSKINGAPSQTIRYRNSDGSETEITFVICGSYTFGISVQTNKQGGIENVPNFPLLSKMRSSFTCKVR